MIFTLTCAFVFFSLAALLAIDGLAWQLLIAKRWREWQVAKLQGNAEPARLKYERAVSCRELFFFSDTFWEK